MAEPVQILSIAQITRKIRMMLEIQVGEVWVEGEVSNARAQKSGHVYFTLKDDTAQLACVLFRGAASKNRVELRDGMNVQAFGEITVYEAQGKYQLVVSRLQEKGVGALQARFEALKRRLQEEGLFDTARKRPIAGFPGAIGLVTSPTGAAVRDLLSILARRAPWTRVIVAPVRVQGKGAEDEIAAAIALLNRESGKSLPELDTLIVGRGGGSIEDLWCFNEEVVARAIVASAIPVISAVGHEIDFTIADFAADLRAPTPSAAAELATPDGAELRRRLATLGGKMSALVRRKVEYLDRLLAGRSRESLRRGPEFVLREAGQNLDRAAENLHAAMADRFDAIALLLDRASRTLAAARPDLTLDRAAERIERARGQLEGIVARRLDRATERAASLRALLSSLGPETTLKRGFSLTLGPDGRPLRRAADVQPGQRLRTRLADGEITSVVDRAEDGF